MPLRTARRSPARTTWRNPARSPSPSARRRRPSQSRQSMIRSLPPTRVSAFCCRRRPAPPSCAAPVPAPSSTTMSRRHRRRVAWTRTSRSSIPGTPALTPTSRCTIQVQARPAGGRSRSTCHTQIWNATIVSHAAGTYIIGNAAWNGQIPQGGQTDFGFIGSGPANPSSIQVHAVNTALLGQQMASAFPASSTGNAATPVADATAAGSNQAQVLSQPHG